VKKGFLVIVGLVSLLNANVTIKSESFQEKKIGKETKWIKASKVIPGTKIKYVNTISNDTSNTATNLVATNVIPKFMTYTDGSAKCKTPCKVVFSVDGGKTFDLPNNLFVVENGKKRVARANEYGAVRWTILSLGAGQKDECIYEAVLK